MAWIVPPAAGGSPNLAFVATLMDPIYPPGRFYMPRARQASKGKRRSMAVPVLGAAGLSLSLASGAYGASSTPAPDMLSRNAEVTHEIALREEEISDASLATFHAFD